MATGLRSTQLQQEAMSRLYYWYCTETSPTRYQEPVRSDSAVLRGPKEADANWAASAQSRCGYHCSDEGWQHSVAPEAVFGCLQSPIDRITIGPRCASTCVQLANSRIKKPVRAGSYNRRDIGITFRTDKEHGRPLSQDPVPNCTCLGLLQYSAA